MTETAHEIMFRALREIAGEDYRGNRPSSVQIAEGALARVRAANLERPIRASRPPLASVRVVPSDDRRFPALPEVSTDRGETWVRLPVLRAVVRQDVDEPATAKITVVLDLPEVTGARS